MLLLRIVLLLMSSAVFGDQTPSNPGISSEYDAHLNISLDEATSLGIQNNLDLMATKFSIPLADAEELTAGLWNNPSLLVDSQLRPFGNNWNQSSTGGAKQDDFILTVPLDLSGKRRLSRKSAHEATLSSEASFQNSVRQKILEIRLAYIDVITLKPQVELFREKESNLRRLVQMVQARIGNNRLLPLLQIRAQLAVDQALLDVQRKESSLVLAVNHLGTLLGRGFEKSRLEPVTRLRDFKMTSPGEFEGLLQNADQFRSDLKSLRLQLSKAKVDQDVARARVWDDFALGAGVSLQEGMDANPSVLGSGPQPGAWSWLVNLSIPLPIWNQNQGNVHKSVIFTDQVETQISALRLSIREELNSAFEQLRVNESSIQNYEGKQLKNARLVRDTAQRSFGTGSSGVLEYFDAMSAYHTTLSNYYDTVGDYRRSQARLNAAVGKDVLK